MTDIAWFAPPSPDVIGAMIGRLRVAPPIAQYTNTKGVNRISEQLSAAWQMPDYAIVLTGAGGPPGDEEIGLMRERFDVFCFGPGPSYATRRRTSKDLWRIVNAFLCPDPGLRIPNGFVGGRGANRVRVHKIAREIAPITGVYRNTDWARTMCSYIVTYGSLPA